MNLADRIVALGVGIHDPSLGGRNYWIQDRIWPPIPADKFTHSWEVAGALMEKCQKVYVEYIGEPEQTVYARAENNRTWDWLHGDSLPHVIIQACVEALEA